MLVMKALKLGIYSFYYDPVRERILIIKLGAIGDVLRTTPLLRRLKQLYPHAEIWWLSHTPEVLPTMVDRRLLFNLSSTLLLESTTFDIVYNLETDNWGGREKLRLNILDFSPSEYK